MAAISAGGAQSHASLVQPIIFCGPGSNLYPLCSNTVAPDDSKDSSQTAQNDLPKAMLPIFNRPMIAFALQQLLSAGLRHAIVFAPSEHHSTIAAALKSLILIPPTLVQSGKKHVSSAAAAAAAAAVEEASKYPNVSVSVGLNSTTSTAPAATNSYLSGNAFTVSSIANETVMRVDLLPLGPDDAANSKTDSRISTAASKYKKLGTAGLVSWLHSIGRLDKDPLILPVDLITQPISLIDIINSHVSGVPHPPALTCLMYERGAGEGTGKEREKDGPPKLFSAYDRSFSQSSTSASGGSDHCTTHQLLLLQDSDDISDLDSSDLHLRMSLLWSHPHVRVSTSLLDSHVYLFDLQQLLSLLRSDAGQKRKSLREEIVPFMVKCSWMTGLREKAGWTSHSPKSLVASQHLSSWNIRAGKESASNALRSSTFVESELLQAGSAFCSPLDDAESRASPLFISERSHLASPSGKLDDGKRIAHIRRQARASAKKAVVESRVNALICRLSADRKHPIDPSSSIEEFREREEAVKREPFIARANTVPTYLECNRYLLRCLASSSSSSSAPAVSAAALVHSSALSHPLPNQTLSAPAASTGSAVANQAAADSASQGGQDGIDPKAQISSDSLVENFTRVGERTTIKRSVIGRGCVIGKNVKLTGAIVMDGVRIGDNAKLENCILSAGSVVEEKCNLKDCDVAASVRVASGTNTKGEKFDE
ncbi:related to GCD1 - gamma subunit of the translation initiation factor eIF2B [Melanopsichium pennsylvanicum]|uniref:Translation initiation factor eIF2B subunit gamma n=2 Tax=Melanopsichium pennsylvanicum TaxID=63383 RepID=A0AAJ4XM60_9BASI|nr:nucleotide-diphospho-sugar transferase [Melanopsichium pennsylvanicum 4]SNX83603.1 related to GCD1 - gamma subunit of the translation initiation factor eIF2B [Melanopsichium pennsylvanicum]